jgi:hypothetical protein
VAADSRFNLAMRTAIALALCIASVALAAPKKKAKKHAPAATASAPSDRAASPTGDEPPDPNAKSRFTTPRDATESAAYRYGQLSRVECESELRARKIHFTRESARGVLAPVRLAGPLRGVTFHTDLRPSERASSPWEIADCRLVLALDDFAAILARHDIVEVVHYSMYRKPPNDWPDDKIGKRHDGALALDAARFIARDGSSLDVLHDFHGAIGAKTCGDDATPSPVTPEATALRELLCETVAARIFNVVLTPNYNKPHANHFHLEVTSGVKWFLVH